MAGARTDKSVGKNPSKQEGDFDPTPLSEPNRGTTPEERRLVSAIRDASQRDVDPTKIEIIYEPQDFVKADDLPDWARPALEAGYAYAWADNMAGHAGSIDEMLQRKLTIVRSKDTPKASREGAPIYHPVNMESPVEISSRIPKSAIDDTYGCVTKRSGAIVQFLLWTRREFLEAEKRWPGELSQATYRSHMNEAKEKGVKPINEGDSPSRTHYTTYHPVTQPDKGVTADDVRADGHVPGTDPELGVQVEVGEGVRS